MRVGLLISCFILCLSKPLLAEDSKYAPIASSENTARVPISSSPEEKIRWHINDQLGEKPSWAGVSQRVIEVSLIKQIAGPDRGKYLADVSYFMEPARFGHPVSKDGIALDALRILRALLRDLQLKKAHVADFMLKPFVMTRDSGQQQVGKFELRRAVADLVGKMRDGDVDKFQGFLQSKGQLVWGLYLVKNGGKHFILTNEQVAVQR